MQILCVVSQKKLLGDFVPRPPIFFHAPNNPVRWTPLAATAAQTPIHRHSLAVRLVLARWSPSSLLPLQPTSLTSCHHCEDVTRMLPGHCSREICPWLSKPVRSAANSAAEGKRRASTSSRRLRAIILFNSELEHGSARDCRLQVWLRPHSTTPTPTWILAETFDTRDFLKLFLWQAERHADILATILATIPAKMSVSVSWNAALTNLPVISELLERLVARLACITVNLRQREVYTRIVHYSSAARSEFGVRRPTETALVKVIAGVLLVSDYGHLATPRLALPELSNVGLSAFKT